jgi:hypothetical protein
MKQHAVIRVRSLRGYIDQHPHLLGSTGLHVPVQAYRVATAWIVIVASDTCQSSTLEAAERMAAAHLRLLLLRVTGT